jgi:hypothetical protein
LVGIPLVVVVVVCTCALVDAAEAIHRTAAASATKYLVETLTEFIVVSPLNEKTSSLQQPECILESEATARFDQLL